MSFVLTLAWRDSRSSRRRLAFSALAIVLGVAALVGIGSLADNVRRGMDGQIRALLGADIVVSSRSPFTEELETHLKERGFARSDELLFNSMAVFPSKEGEARLVQVRAVDEQFPLYGDFVTVPASATASLHQGDHALLDETLLNQYELHPGDKVKLGRTEFTIVGELKKIPGESLAVSLLSPRIVISRAKVEATGLVQPGSLVRHAASLKLPPGASAAEEKAAVREKFRVQGAQVETVEDRTRNLGRMLTNVDSFLSLVGFVALILGAVGVASAVQVYIRQKLATVAVLRCLGCSRKQAFSIYLLQGLAVGVLGALLGALLGVLIHYVVLLAAGNLLPVETPWFISWPAVLKGFGAGTVVCLLFSLHPLLQVRRVSPLLALRSEFSSERRGLDLLQLLLWLVVAGFVIGFAILQAGHLWLGLGFALMLGLGLAVLTGAAKALAWAARRFCPPGLPYAFRQGVANLHRPQNLTVLLLLALGLGTFLVVTIDLARATQLRSISTQLERGQSNLIFFGVQDDQIEGFRQLLAEAGSPLVQEAPIVTMRLSRMKGKPVSDWLDEKGPQRRAGWALTREYRSSYRSEPGPSERLVAGRWVGRVEPGIAVVPISMERELAKDLGLALGDELEFDVQGVPLQTRIASLREVEWRRLEPNFFILFPAGVLEAAPHFFMAGTHAKGAAESARLQRLVVKAYPNVSAIDLSLLVGTIEGITGKVELVVRVVALFTGATGLLVLAGAMLAGRFQRVRETVLLRTLGATRRQLVQLQTVEHAILGFLASSLGCGLAAIANQLLASFVFKTPAAWPLGSLALAIGLVTGLTVLVGWLSNRDLLDEPPLSVLRRET